MGTREVRHERSRAGRRVLATPGHTFTHLSYALQAAGHPHAVFTGGSLLYGSTGRPDLLGRGHAGELAHAQFASEAPASGPAATPSAVTPPPTSPTLRRSATIGAS